MMPERCPQSVKNEYMNSVELFIKQYSEFDNLIKHSKFRGYAIDNFSNQEKISESECLLLKSALDDLVNSKAGVKSMVKNTEVMRTNPKK